jgi:hypothetical protein
MKLKIFTAIIISAFISSCTIPQPNIIKETGTLLTDITDKSSDEFSQVWVNIKSITAVNQDTDQLVILTTSNSVGSFNLLSLRDYSERLSTMVLPDGYYGDIKVELDSESKIIVFDLQGNKKEVELIQPTLTLNDFFEIKNNETTTLTIDFDVNAWTESLLEYINNTTDEALDPKTLTLKKDNRDKPVLVQTSGVMDQDEDGNYYIDFPGKKHQYKITLDPNTDKDTLKVGEPVDIEGIMRNGLLIINEIKQQSVMDEETQKVIKDLIKVYGIVEFINVNSNGELISAQVKISKSTPKALNRDTVNILFDGAESIKYLNGDELGVQANSEIKVVGELLSSSLSDLTAYTVTFKENEVNPIEERAQIKRVEKIKCSGFDSNNISCELKNASETLTLPADRLMVSESTKRCFEPGEFINAIIEGDFIASSNSIVVNKIESSQRCYADTGLITGLITGFSCSNIDNENAIVGLEGELTMVSITNSEGLILPSLEGAINIKIRKSDGYLSIVEYKSENMLRFFSLDSISDPTAPYILSIEDKVYIYENAQKLADGEQVTTLTAESIGGYIKLTNVLGESVIFKPVNKNNHRRSVECSFDIEVKDQQIQTIKTDKHTLWVGTQYKLENGREMTIVMDEDNIATSISFEGLATDDKVLDEIPSSIESKEYQDRVKDAIKDVSQGGLDSQEIGKNTYKVGESKEEKEKRLSLANQEQEQKNKENIFVLDEFSDELKRFSLSLLQDINASAEIQNKTDVINELPKSLLKIATTIKEKLNNYESNEAAEKLRLAVDNMEELYDILNDITPFFVKDINGNNIPIAVNDNITVSEDAEIIIDVLVNDTDLDDDQLMVIGTSATYGTVFINTDQTLTYKGNLNHNGYDSIIYTISDSKGGEDQAAVLLTVLPKNDSPTSRTINKMVVKTDEIFKINISKSFTDIERDILTYSIGAVSWASIDAETGVITGTPTLDGDYTISVTATDPGGLSVTEFFTLTVVKSNQNPTANDDEVITTEGYSVAISVLKNDIDIDGDEIKIITATANNGVIEIINDDFIKYTPNLDFYGEEVAQYSISDGIGGVSTAEIKITVNELADKIYKLKSTQITAKQASMDLYGIDITEGSEELIIKLDVNIDMARNKKIDVKSIGAGEFHINIDEGKFEELFKGSGVTRNSITNVNLLLEYTKAKAESMGDGVDFGAVFASLNVNKSTLPMLTLIDDVETKNFFGGTSRSDAPSELNLISYYLNPKDAEINHKIIYTASYYYNIDQPETTEGIFVENVVANILVENINNYPTAEEQSVETMEDVEINILTNAVDIDGDMIEVESASASSGVVTINADQSLTYQPNSNFNGEDVIEYTLSDSKGGRSIALINVIITPVNDNPILLKLIPKIPAIKGDNFALDISGYFTDIDGDTLTYSVSGADWVNINATSGVITGTPLDLGSYSVTIIATDNDGTSVSATVVWEVQDANNLPVAVDDIITTDEEEAVTINALANDTDSDGDTLTITVATTTNGNVSINADGTLTYQGETNFNGTDVITYTITDGLNESTATVTVTILPINDEPIGRVIITGTVASGETLTATNTLTDADGLGTINYKWNIAGLEAPGSQYTLDTLDRDKDIYVEAYYTDVDGTAEVIRSSSIKLTIINNAPTSEVIPNKVITTSDLFELDVSGYFTDIDGDILTYSISGVDWASVDATSGVITGDPKNAAATNTIIVKVTDPSGLYKEENLIITVIVDQTAPIANNDAAVINEDTSVTINVLDNDIDDNKDTLKVVSAVSENGVIVINNDQTLTYTPKDNFNGLDTIIYILENQYGLRALKEGNVIVGLNPINDAPTVTQFNDNYQGGVNDNFELDISGYFTDVDGDTLTYSISGVSWASMNSGTGIITGTTSTSGEYIISVKATDSGGLFVEQELKITMMAELIPAYLLNISNQSVDEDSDVSIDINAYVVNEPQSRLSYLMTGSDWASIDASGKITGTPTNVMVGTELITVSIIDTVGVVVSKDFVLTVTNTNDAPTAVNDSRMLVNKNGVSETINVMDNDFDVDIGDNLSTYNATANNGVVELTLSGELYYTPDFDFVGTDLITYTLSDGELTDTGEVAVEVKSVTDQIFNLVTTTTTAEQASIDLYGIDVTGGSQELILKMTVNISMDRNTNPDVASIGAGTFDINIDETQFENLFTGNKIETKDAYDGVIEYGTPTEGFDMGAVYANLNVNNVPKLTYIDLVDTEIEIGNTGIFVPSANDVPSQIDLITYYLNPLDTETSITATYNYEYIANMDQVVSPEVTVTGITVDIEIPDQTYQLTSTIITAAEASIAIYGEDYTEGSTESIIKIVVNIDMANNVNPLVDNIGAGSFNLNIDETQFENMFTNNLLDTSDAFDPLFLVESPLDSLGIGNELEFIYTSSNVLGDVILTLIDEVDTLTAHPFLPGEFIPSPDDVSSELDLITIYLNPLDSETDISVTYDATYKYDMFIPGDNTGTVEITGVQVDIM